MKRLIAVSLLALLAVGCKDDEPPVIASKWAQAPETIISGDTMKVLRDAGRFNTTLRVSWRKYEMFNCGDGKMTSIGFDSTQQIDTLVDMGWGQWMTVQEKREFDKQIKNRMWRIISDGEDTVWVW